ncbi:MAG: hypothetical protein U0R64_05950 [Candidatus Nanopelagicales bacterium]
MAWTVCWCRPPTRTPSPARSKQLIDDPALRRRLAAAGRDLYERRFSRAVADLGQLYRELGLAVDST